MTWAWYALSVKPKHEKAASLMLKHKELEVIHPVCRTHRRWSDRIKEIEAPLFPGYIFCRFGFERRMNVLTTPGVTAIISAGKQPCPVPDHEISAVQSIVSSGRHAVSWPYLSVGRSVQVTTGCLEGLVGTVVRDKDLFRVVVSVELLQRSVAVEIDRSDLAPARPPSPVAPDPYRIGLASPLWP